MRIGQYRKWLLDIGPVDYARHRRIRLCWGWRADAHEAEIPWRHEHVFWLPRLIVVFRQTQWCGIRITFPIGVRVKMNEKRAPRRRRRKPQSATNMDAVVGKLLHAAIWLAINNVKRADGL